MTYRDWLSHVIERLDGHRPSMLVAALLLAVPAAVAAEPAPDAEPRALAVEPRARDAHEPMSEPARDEDAGADTDAPIQPVAPAPEPELTPEEVVRQLGRTPKVRKVSIRGNGKIDDDDLLEGLATRPASGWWLWRDEYQLDTVALERDRRRIETYYHERGYFSAEVTRVELRAVDGGRVDVIFHMQEGAPSVLTDVVIQGAPARPTGKLARDLDDRPAVHESALRRLIDLPLNQRFMYERYELGEAMIGQALRLAGFAHAEVRGRVAVDRVARRVGVRYELDPGPRVRFGEVRVVGLESLPESVVRNRIAWQPGEIFDPRDVVDTRRSLQGLRRFQTVRIELADPTPRPVADVRITAVEALPREVRLGVGVGVDSSHSEVRGRAGYRVFGLPDALSTFSTELRPALAYERATGEGVQFVGEAVASIVREDLFLPLLRGETRLAYTLEKYEAYHSEGGRFRAGVGRAWLSDRLRVSLGWQLELLHIPQNKVHEAISEVVQQEIGLNDFYQLGLFEQAVAWDTRDNPLDARRGIYAEVRLREGGPYAGGEFSFITVSPEVRGYLSLGEQLTLAARVRYGQLLAGPGLPITERYFSGGASAHRGFPQRRLSPAAVDDDDTPDDGMDGDAPSMMPHAVAIGGEALFETSAEARLDLFHFREQWVGVVAFIDGGRVTTRPEVLDPFAVTELYWATGTGLRYDTPVGPLRVDVGYRLNRHGYNRLVSDDTVWDRFAVHLSIGEAF
ncbi:MAG TPA: BamA/TamA family outer membrane protein [Haliangium sp.]|nr:BamA/TamA family outer membrane protein [Haliangium sp.]